MANKKKGRNVTEEAEFEREFERVCNGAWGAQDVHATRFHGFPRLNARRAIPRRMMHDRGKPTAILTNGDLLPELVTPGLKRDENWRGSWPMRATDPPIASVTIEFFSRKFHEFSPASYFSPDISIDSFFLRKLSIRVFLYRFLELIKS